MKTLRSVTDVLKEIFKTINLSQFDITLCIISLVATLGSFSKVRSLKVFKDSRTKFSSFSLTFWPPE